MTEHSGGSVTLDERCELPTCAWDAQRRAEGRPIRPHSFDASSCAPYTERRYVCTGCGRQDNNHRFDPCPGAEWIGYDADVTSHSGRRTEAPMRERLLVFDPKVWGGRDKGDNSHCWRSATVLRRYTDPCGRLCVDVRFDHDGRESRGHFLDGTKSLTGRPEVKP